MDVAGAHARSCGEAPEHRSRPDRVDGPPRSARRMVPLSGGLPASRAQTSCARSASRPKGQRCTSTHDRPVFSIPAQYRVEVALDLISPHLRNAVLAVEDARFYEHDGIDGIRVIGAMLRDVARRPRGRRGEHDYAAAGASQLPVARQDAAAKSARGDTRPANRKDVQQGSDSRNLSEQGLLRRWALRRRSGRARILRQAGVGRVGRRSRACWPASSRRRRR